MHDDDDDGTEDDARRRVQDATTASEAGGGVWLLATMRRRKQQARRRRKEQDRRRRDHDREPAMSMRPSTTLWTSEGVVLALQSSSSLGGASGLGEAAGVLPSSRRGASSWGRSGTSLWTLCRKCSSFRICALCDCVVRGEYVSICGGVVRGESVSTCWSGGGGGSLGGCCCVQVRGATAKGGGCSTTGCCLRGGAEDGERRGEGEGGWSLGQRMPTMRSSSS
mmetsp:Transcript_207/g.592  ORF Transcript_207/g.592 Transcript_207/m.592 type:complete len:223 (-) Transcript_207:982-1650(-)